MNPEVVKPGIIRCEPMGDGYVDATIVVPGTRSVAQLEAIKASVLGQSNLIKNNDYDACSSLRDEAGKPVLKFSLRFHSLMASEAQLAVLDVFKKALSPFIEIKGFDFSQLATHPTVH